MTNNQYRMSELLTWGWISLEADSSKDLMLGVLAGLEQFADKTLRVFKVRRISLLQG